MAISFIQNDDFGCDRFLKSKHSSIHKYSKILMKVVFLATTKPAENNRYKRSLLFLIIVIYRACRHVCACRYL